MKMLSQLAPVLSASSMREADRKTIEEIGIPGFTLMESAGREVAEVAQEMIEIALNPFNESSPELVGAPSAHVICLCGKGNNGGDGFVVARYLSDYGHQVSVVLMADAVSYAGDAAANLAILQRIAEHQPIDIVELHRLSDLEHLQPADLLIDALVGTGLNAALRDPLSGVVSWMNAQKAPILSVDMPSGLSADTGRVWGRGVQAHVTVTMGALKVGQLIEDGPDYVGALHVVDIGIPGFVLNSLCSGKQEIRVSNDDFIGQHVPLKTRKDHKYTSGPTLVMGGSAEFPGAPVLAALSAARSGSGYVVCVGPASIRDLLQDKLAEIPVEAWENPPPGQAAESTFNKLIERLDVRWSKAKALLLGPGLGRGDVQTALVRFMLESFDGPVVVDADALFALRDQKDWVREHSEGRWLFTPHDGEFNRMGGQLSDQKSRIEAAREFAADWNVTLLLKGQPSMTVGPKGSVVINTTGNPGNPSVGTAGTGDVLGGVVASLLAQGLSPFNAAVCGIHLAGTAADLYVEEHATGSMMASDLIMYIPQSLALFQ